jgi:hypothetical protein
MNDMLSLFRYRIFITAIAASLLWHVFWLSAVKVVSEPANRRAVKFSKVSFLGPFLERGAINLRVQPRERAFLEKRYLLTAGNFAGDTAPRQEAEAYKYEPDGTERLLSDKNMANFIDEALAGPKPEPDYSVE